MKEIGMYIHIPFCKQKCYYCDFISFACKENFVKKYIDALKKEIHDVLSVQKYNIKTIYIGGGTPSYINSKYIKEILNLIYAKAQIDINAEITIEINPGTINKQKLEDYFSAGINRISIGLQSTNDEVLKTIGRIHNYNQFIETYNLARKAGFKNINVDLMFGLPKQNLEILEESVDKIIELKPEHVSVYSLILEDDTELKNKIEKNELELPNEELERIMYWRAKEKLENQGYNHYEISNFAKKGFESKHNMDCWSQKEYIGIGLAAHSYQNNTRYSNTEELEKYIEFQNQEKIIHEKQMNEDKKKEYMLLGLRKIDGIKISDFKNKFIDNPIYLYKDNLNKLVNEDLIQIDNDVIKLTNKGIDFANVVWEEFI